VYFKPHKTIKSTLDQSKDSIDHNSRKGAIYEIHCAECQQVSAGETIRSFSTRYREHKWNVRNELLSNFTGQNQNKSKTAQVKHVQGSNRDVDWENCKILHFKTNFIKHRFLESYIIHQNNNSSKN